MEIQDRIKDLEQKARARIAELGMGLALFRDQDYYNLSIQLKAYCFKDKRECPEDLERNLTAMCFYRNIGLIDKTEFDEATLKSLEEIGTDVNEFR